MTTPKKGLLEMVDDIEQYETELAPLDFENAELLPWDQWEFLSEGQRKALKDMYPDELAEYLID